MSGCYHSSSNCKIAVRIIVVVISIMIVEKRKSLFQTSCWCEPFLLWGPPYSTVIFIVNIPWWVWIPHVAWPSWMMRTSKHKTPFVRWLVRKYSPIFVWKSRSQIICSIKVNHQFLWWKLPQKILDRIIFKPSKFLIESSAPGKIRCNTCSFYAFECAWCFRIPKIGFARSSQPFLLAIPWPPWPSHFHSSSSTNGMPPLKSTIFSSFRGIFPSRFRPFPGGFPGGFPIANPWEHCGRQLAQGGDGAAATGALNEGLGSTPDRGWEKWWLIYGENMEVSWWLIYG